MLVSPGTRLDYADIRGVCNITLKHFSADIRCVLVRGLRIVIRLPGLAVVAVTFAGSDWMRQAQTPRSYGSKSSRRRHFGTVFVPTPPSLAVRALHVRTITVANQKGGCGKTTVAINLSASLAREARRVLLVDLDPQAHCALGMAVPEEQIDLSMLDCLLPQDDGEPLELSRITWQIAPNLDLAPSRSNLATLEPRLGTRDEADILLSDLLEANAGRYDYCVVDCPPHLGLLMKNGLRAADEIIIPVDTGYFSLHGLTQQLGAIDLLSERYGIKPVVRVLANQYDVRTKLAREILAEVRKRYHGIVYNTIVNFNTKLKEGASFGQPITEFAPTSMGARDFQELARELISHETPDAASPDILEHIERLAADADRLLATTTTLVDSRTARAPAPQTPRTAAIRPPANVPEVTPSVGDRRGAPPVAPVPGPRGPGEHLPRTVTPSVASGARATEIKREMPATSPPAYPTPVTPPAPQSRPEEVHPKPEAANKPIDPIASVMTPWQTPAPLASPSAGGESEDSSQFQPSLDLPMPSQPQESRGTSREAEEIEGKIEAIYGVRQDGDMMVFRGHHPGATDVQLAGDFNDWMPHTSPMNRLADGDFEAKLRLPRGRYRYRLVIDGRWSHDQNNPAVETNEYGELNSVVDVAK